MKEVKIEGIRKIEHDEVRSLVCYEQLIAKGKSGGIKRAVGEIRTARINVLETAASRFDGRALRNARINAVAAKHRAGAAERQAIQDAVDEVLALGEIVPADDIDDILSTVSAELGIELPGQDAKADICQRGPKSIQDLKRELGPSIANAVQQGQLAVADILRVEELIADLRRTSLLQGMEAAPISERFFEVGQDRQKAEDALLNFVQGLAAKAHGLTDQPDLDEETLDLAWEAANDPT